MLGLLILAVWAAGVWLTGRFFYVKMRDAATPIEDARCGAVITGLCWPVSIVVALVVGALWLLGRSVSRPTRREVAAARERSRLKQREEVEHLARDYDLPLL